ncbi:hypothetical protein LA080_009315 [Diaporthe eres]|nr:hypothetical protein LA080_009315 [Diaporthe eres]
MKVDHTTLLLAVQLLFIAYVLAPTGMAANRATLLWAVEALCLAEFLSRGVVLFLEKMIVILAPSTPGRRFSTTIGVMLPLPVNLHFIRCFLEQSQPEAPTFDITFIHRGHIAFMVLSILLLASAFLSGTWRYLRASRSPDLEGHRRRIQEFRRMLSALLDAFIGIILALRSHQLLWDVLVAVAQSRNIPEARLDRAGILDRMNQISKDRVLLGWLLEIQNAHMGQLENRLRRWFFDALDIPE